MSSRLSALKHRNYALLWVGSVVSNIGSGMQMVAQGWYVYNLTGSAIDLGMVGVARSVPMLLLPLVAGVYIDRMPRMLLLKATQSANFVVSFALATLVVLARWKARHEDTRGTRRASLREVWKYIVVAAPALLLPFLILDEGMPEAEAIEVASKAGLKVEALKDLALQYVAAHKA